MRIIASRRPARPGDGQAARLPAPCAGALRARAGRRARRRGPRRGCWGPAAGRASPARSPAGSIPASCRRPRPRATPARWSSRGATARRRPAACSLPSRAAAGLRVTQNRSGSNLLQGVISAAVQGTDLRGRMDAQLLLLEVDEATVRLVAPERAAGHVADHQHLPRPAGPVRGAVRDGEDAGGRHRGAARVCHRGAQRRRSAGGQPGARGTRSPPVLRHPRPTAGAGAAAGRCPSMPRTPSAACAASTC